MTGPTIWGPGSGVTDGDLSTVLSREVLAHMFWTVAELVSTAHQQNGSHPYWERYSKLTSRETEVLGLLCAYKKPKSIAQELNISLYTARDHVDAILKKLQVHTYKEAADLARREMFVD